MINIFAICTIGSIVSTIIAGTCQPRLNYKIKSVTGVNPIYLCCWISADFLNMAGCFLTGKLFFQKMCASYMFWIVDIIQGSQYIYYSRLDIHRKREEEEERQMQVDRNNDDLGSMHMGEVNYAYRSLPHYSSNTLANGLIFSNVLATTVNSMPIGINQETTNLISNNSDFFNFRFAIGTLFLYLCTIIYIIARLPQLYHNYRHRSTEGISKGLFGCIIIANIFNIFAMVFSPRAQAGGSDVSVFWKEQIAFIGCYVGSLICDISIIGQYIWFDIMGKGSNCKRKVIEISKDTSICTNKNNRIMIASPVVDERTPLLNIA